MQGQLPEEKEGRWYGDGRGDDVAARSRPNAGQSRESNALGCRRDQGPEQAAIVVEFKGRPDAHFLWREREGRKRLVATVALFLRPANDGFAEHDLPLQRLVGRVELRVPRWRFELSIIALSPFDVAAELLIADKLDAQVANVATPELHDAPDLPQHMDRGMALGMLCYS